MRNEDKFLEDMFGRLKRHIPILAKYPLKNKNFATKLDDHVRGIIGRKAWKPFFEDEDDHEAVMCRLIEMLQAEADRQAAEAALWRACCVQARFPF